MRQKCRECEQAHANSYKVKQAGPACLYHDPPERLATAVVAQLTSLVGLPDDCPGCLGKSTIEAHTFGSSRAKNTRKLVCSACTTSYYIFKKRGWE